MSSQSPGEAVPVESVEAARGAGVLAGGGDMGARMRAIDWAATPLGPVERWPQSLKTAVRILLTSRQPMFVWWGESLINLYNDAYRSILGGKHPDALGRPAPEVWREIWHEIGPRAQRALGGDEGTYDESLQLIMHRNGYPEETYYTFSYSPVPSSDDGVGGIFCANSDDTARIIGERQLHLLRELAVRTAEARSFADACERSLRCLALDPRDFPFAAMYRVDAEQGLALLAGTTGVAAGHAAAPQQVKLADAAAPWPFAAALETQQPQIVRALAFELPSGAWDRPPQQAIVVPVISGSGQTALLVAGLNPYRLFDDDFRGFIELVTSQIAAGLANAQAYEDERRRAEALAEIDRAKTVFFSNVSHEFRTPLTLMLGPLQDALERHGGALPAEARDSLDLVQRNGRRLLRLVNSLLDFSRIEAGRLQAQYQPLDLAALTADLASVFRAAMDKAGLVFEVDCPPQPQPVYVDRDLWEKIVLNLLANAFKYTFDGRIAVSLRQENGQAVLRVRDTGTGIPAADLSRIFERFHRVENARGRTHEGSGIGLALVQELAHLHGGAVEAQSTEGQGSVFTVRLPLGSAHLPQERIVERAAGGGGSAPLFAEEALRWLPDSAPSVAADSADETTGPVEAAGAHILLADDNADMRDYLQRLLSRHYRVTAVADGEQALAAIRRDPPELVLSDVMMPRLDGMGLLRALRAEAATAALPLILLSARAGEEARVEGLDAGADDYLIKPFSARELLARVGAQLTLARLRTHNLTREQALRTEAERMNDVALSLSSELNLDALLQKVTDIGTAITGAQFGAFFYNSTNERGESYLLYTLAGASRASFEKLGLPRNTALFDPTFSGSGVVRLDDVTRDTRYGHMPEHRGMPQGHLPVRSYLAVPVKSRTGSVLGGLFFGHAHVARFDEHAERLATGIAAQAAVAIDNARLYEQAKTTIDRSIRAEGAWRESERRYRQLVHGLPAAVYTTDVEGRVTLYNEAAAALWGRRPELGRDFWHGTERVFDLDGRPLPVGRRPLARVLAGESLPPTEIVIARADGTRRHVIVHPQLIVDAEGEASGALNMLIDITERKQAEAELAATKDDLALQVQTLSELHELAGRLAQPQELRSALEAILQTLVRLHGADFGLVSMHDAESGRLVEGGRLGFSAEFASRLTGFVPAPGVGACGHAYVTGERVAVEDVETDACFEPFREVAREAGFRAVHSTPVITRAGQVLGVLSVHFRGCRLPTQREMQLADLCARHAADAIEASTAQQALRESERLYRAIGDSIDYGVWICDAAGELTYVSESLLRLVGCSLEQMRETGWGRFVDPEQLKEVMQAWRHCVAQSEGQWDAEIKLLGVDGLWHPVLVRGVLVRDEQGAVTGWTGINLDISRLKDVESELRDVDRRKNEFLAVLAHELRNPLAPIRNGLEVIKLAGSDPQMVAQIREMMERQLGHMVRLIDDLLDLSRITQGKIELRRQRTDIGAVLQNAIEASRPTIEQAGHTLSVTGPAGAVPIEADITRLSQVFSNLLNNAAKYTKEGGRIWVTITRLGNKVFVSVKDNGVGIPAHMLPQVFEMFTQVDRSLERSQSGLGIGLSISKRLVEMHGGIIEVRSDGYGKGSEFLVRLPAAASTTEDMAPVNDKKDIAGKSPSHRILVVDDNADSAASMAIICEVMGNEVRTAGDGLQAVEVAEVFRPNVILMDIGMPRLNGYEACKRIREQDWGRDAIIIALTGWGQEEDRRKSQAAGFNRHLVKPVSFEAIKGLLAELSRERV